MNADFMKLYPNQDELRPNTHRKLDHLDDVEIKWTQMNDDIKKKNVMTNRNPSVAYKKIDKIIKPRFPQE